MSRKLTPDEEKTILFLVRETASEFAHELLNGEDISGADFLDSMGPALALLKVELEDKEEQDYSPHADCDYE